jgi:1-acyl-sn-glycerol-3-phosphate acyltransferase
MLDFTDKPYRYYPPEPNLLLIWIFRQWNRFVHLPGREHLIEDVTVDNPRELKPCAGSRIMFLPNHATHSDPQIMMEVQRQVGVPSMFMAAYDLFERSRFRAWVMQKSGVFSVDREGSDSQAMKQAINTLVDGRYALTVFAEGNVYLMNDRVTPFLDGAAFMAMKAQKKLGPETPVYVVPVSIKVTHTSDRRRAIRDLIGQVAEGAGVTFDRQADPVVELKKIGVEVLKKKLSQQGYFPPQTGTEDIPLLLDQAAGMIIAALEEKMELKARDKDDLVTRIRKIRQGIHRIRIDPEKSVVCSTAASWAEEAILAFRILMYSGRYLDDSPTMDRFGETAEKLVEDLYGKAVPPYGRRRARVRFGVPRSLAECLDDFKRNARRVIADLTPGFEQAVQEGLDKLNTENSYPGGERLTDLS